MQLWLLTTVSEWPLAIIDVITSFSMTDMTMNPCLRTACKDFRIRIQIQIWSRIPYLIFLPLRFYHLNQYHKLWQNPALQPFLTLRNDSVRLRSQGGCGITSRLLRSTKSGLIKRPKNGN